MGSDFDLTELVLIGDFGLIDLIGDLGLCENCCFKISLPILPVFETQFPVFSLHMCLPSDALGDLESQPFFPTPILLFGLVILPALVPPACIAFPILLVIRTQFPVFSLQTCLPLIALGELGSQPPFLPFGLVVFPPLAKICFPSFPVFVTQFPVDSLHTCLPSEAFGEFELQGFLLLNDLLIY